MEEKKLLKKKEKAFQAGKIELLAAACDSLGDFYNQYGRYSEAEKEFELGYQYYESLGKRLEMAKASRMVGEMYMLLSEFENALKHINIYLEIVQELKNEVEQQRAFATLGRAHLLHGQSVSESATVTKSLRSAEKAFIKSLLISKELTGQITKLEQLDMQARLYLNIGVVKEHMENFNEALLYMNRAIKICKSNDIYELLHLCYISVCLMYQYKKSDPTKALSVCNLALDVSQRLPNKVTKMCQTLIVKSEIIISIGDFVSAKEVLRKAYKMKTPDLNDKQNIEKTLKIVTAICLIFGTIQKTDADNYEVKRKLFEKLGDGCCLLLNYEYAIIYYLKTLECIEIVKKSDKEFIPIYVSLYQTYKDAKQYKEALEYLWKEYELNRDEHEEAFWTLCNIAEICELESPEFWKLFDVYRKAIQQAQKAKNLKLEKIAYFRVMKLEQKFKMFSMLDILKDECQAKGIDLDTIEEDRDIEETQHSEEQNTPDIGEDISLDDLLDSDSESEEQEKSRSVRKRGNGFSLKRNNKGETQLHSACISGNIALVRHLIDQGHEVNIADYAGWLPLHEACNYGHRDIVELLLDRGAISAINDKGGTSCDGITPLHDACTNGFLEVIELLIDRGANATLRTDFGDTALHALEKWRASVNLDDFEQIQYVGVRNKLQERLLKLGIEKKSDALTNDSIKKTYDNSMKTSNSLNSDSESFKSNDETMQPGPSSFKRSSIRHKTNKSYDDFDRTLTNTSALDSHPSYPHNKGLAELEYRAVMKSLKRPNRLNAISDDDDMTQKRRSAFLDPEEIDDDWLDDDLLPKKKKQKCNETESLICTDGDKSTRKSQSSRTSLDLSSDFLNNDPTSFDVTESVNAFTKLLDLSESRKNRSSKYRNARTATITSNPGTSGINLKQQMTLLDSGFCRFHSNSSLNSDDSSDTRSLILEPTLNHLQNISPMKIDVMQSVPTVSSTISFKIKVEDELLVVPVDKRKIDELDIRWLGEEASRRYTKLVGLKPILRLMTADGFCFEETDTVSVALDQNMIISKVLEWNTSPLSKRYQEMCKKLKQDVNSDLRLALEKSQDLNTLILKDLSLTPNLTEPLFRAIMYQTDLQILDLSKSFIQNEGCKQLAKSLRTLTQLKILNLQGNYITHIGLAYILSAGSSSSTFEELEELSLNDNPLSNRCLRNLDNLCKKCKNLKKLNISHCGITCIYDFDLSLHNLTDLDISFNKLTAASFTKLLAKLNANHLKSLNLNYTLMDETIARQKIHDFLGSGTCEHFHRIELAGCKLIDIDIYKIVQKLSNSTEFEILNLSESNKLTFPAFQYMLKNLRSLKKIQLYRCLNILNMELLQYIPEDHNIPEFIQLTLNPNFDSKEVLKRFWGRHWGDSGQIDFNGSNVILSVKSPDLSSI